MSRQIRNRRKRNKAALALNLVPMLDALVTMIAFLLFSMSFLAIVSIESLVPITSKSYVDSKLQERPLQLTISLNEDQIEVWSPFSRIPSTVIQSLPDGAIDLLKLHDTLVGIKQQFPKETKVVLVPHAGATYDLLISVMDQVRYLTDGDPPIFTRDPESGLDLALEILFPEIVFGNLLGDQ